MDVKNLCCIIVCLAIPGACKMSKDRQQQSTGSTVLSGHKSTQLPQANSVDSSQVQSYQRFLEKYFSRTLLPPLKIIQVSDMIKLEEQSKTIDKYVVYKAAEGIKKQQINPFLLQIEEYYKSIEATKAHDNRLMNYFFAAHPYKHTQAIGKIRHTVFDALLCSVVGAESSQSLAEHHELMLCIFSKQGKLLSVITLIDWEWDFKEKKQHIKIHHQVIIKQNLSIETEVVAPIEEVVDLNSDTGEVKTIAIEKKGDKQYFLISNDGQVRQETGTVGGKPKKR